MKKMKILLGILTILGIVALTIGATYAWFSMVKIGTTSNTISSGSIKFHYGEKSQGLTLNEAMPMSDIVGMQQNDYFEFEITSKTSKLLDIPYYITVRRSGTGTNMDNIVKVYLTKIDGNTEVPVELENGEIIATFNELGTYINNDAINIPISEKLLHRDVVFANSSNYKETYRLRMWISDDTQFIVQEPGQSDVYPYQGKTYTLKVNVYGNGLAINQSTAQFRNNANITDLEIGGNVLETTTDTFTSEFILPPGELNTTQQITVNTDNPNSQVTIENLTPQAMNSNIKRLASEHTINIVLGTNTFRIIVKSEDKRETKIYTLVITAKEPIYDVTFDKQSGSGGTNSVTATYGQAMSAITIPTRIGYTFGGYYTGENGTGTMYYTATGESAKAFELKTNTTLYAKWIINQYNLQISPSVNGTKKSNGHSGFTFDVYINNVLVADDVITYNTKLDYNTAVKVVLNTVTNYSTITSTIEETITSDIELIPAWITSSNIGIQFKYKNSTLIVITQSKTWEAAEAYAQSLGGHLVMIKTADMQNYVYNTILSNSSVSGLASFWIGATDKDKEGDWRWVDGTTLASTYSNWNNGEPNDSNGEDYCQYYISSNKGKWNDLNGTQSYPFVVQIGNP